MSKRPYVRPELQELDLRQTAAGTNTATAESTGPGNTKPGS